jgi:hypothetical protein
MKYIRVKGGVRLVATCFKMNCQANCNRYKKYPHDCPHDFTKKIVKSRVIKEILKSLKGAE